MYKVSSVLFLLIAFVWATPSRFDDGQRGRRRFFLKEHRRSHPGAGGEANDHRQTEHQIPLGTHPGSTNLDEHRRQHYNNPKFQINEIHNEQESFNHHRANNQEIQHSLNRGIQRTRNFNQHRNRGQSDSNNQDYHREGHVEERQTQRHAGAGYVDNVGSSSRHHGKYGGHHSDPIYRNEEPLNTQNQAYAMPYSFTYGVSDPRGTMFGQTEESDGRGVRGSYSVNLPDGRKQIVRYTADAEHGYRAEVTYIGEARQYNHGGYQPNHDSRKKTVHHQQNDYYHNPNQNQKINEGPPSIHGQNQVQSQKTGYHHVPVYY